MICPNKNSNEWKYLMLKHSNNEREALRDWAENNMLDSNNGINISDKTIFIVDKLSKNFPGVDIIYDVNLDVPGKVVKQGDVISLVINPDLIQDDTIAHEFGHIFLDSIGGLENETVKRLLEELTNTDRANVIRNAYSEASVDVQNKEIIIDALGKEVTKTLNNEKDSLITKLLRGILNQISELFEFNNSTIKSLSNQMIKTQFKPNDIVLEEIEYEQKLNSEEQLKKDEAVNKLKVSMYNKINELKAYLVKNEKEIDSNEAIKKFEKIFKDLSGSQVEEGISKFIALGKTNTEKVLNLINKLKEEDIIDLNKLYRIKTYIDAFGPDITDSLLEAFDLSEEDSNNIKELIVNYKIIESDYYNLALKSIKEKINPNFNAVFAFYKRKAIMEFSEYAKSNGIDKRSKEEYEKAKSDYIENYLKNNNDKIVEEIELKKNKFLNVIDRDISYLDYWLTNPRDLNNNIIQEAIKILDEADYMTSSETDDYLIRSKYYYDRYIQFVGQNSNQKVLYEPILARNAKGEVSRALKPLSQLEDKYKGTPVEELLIFLTDAYKQRDSIIPKKYRLNNKLPDVEKDNLERIYERGLFKMIEGAIGDLVKVRAEDTETGVTQSEEGLKDTENYLDKKVKSLVDASGKEKQFIPIHYRNKNLSDEDASYDVMSLLVLDMHQAFNYKNKIKTHSSLMIMKDLLERPSARVNQTYGMSKLAKEVFGVENVNVQKSGKESLIYKALNDLIEVRLFGQKIKGDPNYVKLVKNLKNYVSLSLLSHNWISGSANYIQGTSMNIIKAIGGNEFTLEDYAKAKVKVSKDIGKITTDIANFHHKSKTNLLMRKFQVRSDYNPLISKFSDDNVLKRKASPFSFLYFNEIAEFNIQASNMYASMNNIKVKNKDGQYLDKDGKITTDKSKAMTIDEAYSVFYRSMKTNEVINEEQYDRLSENQKNDYLEGQLELNPLVYSADRIGDLRNEAGSINNRNINKLSSRLREINRSSFGNYDSNNRAAIDRTVPGPLLTHMRQWLVPLLKDRMLGGFSLFKVEPNEKGKKRLKFVSRKDLRIDDIKYNENLDSLQEGFYITTLRYLGETLFKLKFNLLAANWKTLDDYEKANIRKAITETSIMLTFFITAKILSNLKAESDDEDEKQRLLIASILANRAVAELMTFYNPTEWARVMASPAVSLGVVNNLIKAFEQLITDPTEVYQKGKFKGENKAKVYFIRATPLKPLYKDLESINNWLTK